MDVKNQTPCGKCKGTGFLSRIERGEHLTIICHECLGKEKIVFFPSMKSISEYPGILNESVEILSSTFFDIERDFFLKNISRSCCIVFIKDEKVEGVMTLSRTLSQAKSKIFNINFIAVRPEMKGNGIGKRIMNEAFSQAKNYKCESIMLTCNKEKVNYYLELGFNIIKVNYLEYNNHSIKKIIESYCMEKAIV